MVLSEIYKQTFYRGSQAYGDFDVDDILGDKTAEAVISAGDFITIGSANGLVKKVSTTNDIIVGMVPYRIQPMIDADSGGISQFEAKAMVPYVKVGYKVSLTVDINVIAGQPIYINLATGNLTNIATNNLRLARAFFEESVTAGGFAIVSFNLL